MVLGQGLWQLPELHDHFFPVDHEKLLLQQASKEISRIKIELQTFSERLDYLKWFQAYNGPDPSLSRDRLLAFYFSEPIRLLSPNYFWQVNIRLAQKTRLKVARRLWYLKGLLNNLDQLPPAPPSQAGIAIPAPMASVSNSMKQIQQFKNQSKYYNAELIELSKQLAWLENNHYKK